MDYEDSKLLNDYPWFDYSTLPTSLKRKLEIALLMEIVEDSQGELNQDYNRWQKCADLLDNNPFIREILLKCWQSRSFKELRQCSVLQKRTEAEKSQMGSNLIPIPQKNINIYGGTIYEVQGNMINQTIRPRNLTYIQRLKTWICQMDYEAIHQDTLSTHVHGTGTGFIQSQEFSSWAEGDGPLLLWCPGIPGAGKTTIVSLAAQYLRRHGHPVCIVYFSYERQDTQTFSHILASILRQLCGNSILIMDVVEGLYDRHSALGTFPKFEVLLRAVETALSSHSRVYLVLDALDEFSPHYCDETMEDLIRTMIKLGTIASPLKIMITSRVLGRMEAIFETLGALRKEIRATESDIDLYLKNRIHREVRFMEHKSKEIIDRITEVVHGRFLVAQLHMNCIARFFSWGETRDYLAGISDELDVAYRYVFERIRAQDQRRRQLAEKILLWVTCAVRQLSIDELRHATALDSAKSNIEDYLYPTDIITGVCAGIIVIDSEKRIVRFIHQTAHDFFRKTRSTNFPNADRIIAESSILYISVCAATRLQNVGGCNTAASIEKLTQEIPLWEYIGQHLIDHIQGCEAHIFPSIETFEQKHDIVYRVIQLSNMARQWGWLLPSGPSGTSIRSRLLSNITPDGVIPAAVHIAAAWDLSNLLQMLLSRSTDRNLAIAVTNLHDKESYVPLATAVRCSAINATEILLPESMKIMNWRDSRGYSILTLAVENGASELVSRLLNHQGIKVNLDDHDGRTPLMHAVYNTQASITRLLLRRKDVDVNVKDTCGSTASILAFSRQPRFGTQAHVDICQLLLSDHRLDPEIRNNLGATAFTLAFNLRGSVLCRLSCNTLVGLHERYESCIAEQTGHSILTWGARNGLVDVVKRVIHRAPDHVNLGNGKGQTPLMLAALNAHLAIVAILLSNGANVNLQDQKGHTAVMYAVNPADPEHWQSEEQKLGVLKALFAVPEIDPKLLDNSNHTLLMHAAHYPKSLIRSAMSEVVDQEEDELEIEKRIRSYGYPQKNIPKENARSYPTNLGPLKSTEAELMAAKKHCIRSHLLKSIYHLQAPSIKDYVLSTPSRQPLECELNHDIEDEYELL